MDNFYEYLIKKKKTAKDLAIRVLIVILAIVLSGVVNLLFSLISFLSALSFFAVLALCYVAYRLINYMDVEYEYIFTNGDLDIDIIRGQKERKRLATIKCKNIESMKKVPQVDNKAPNGEKIVCAVYDKSRGGIYRVLDSQKGVIIYFQPPERLIEEMKKYNPYNIETE